MLKCLVILGMLLAVAPIVSSQPNKAADEKKEPAKQSQPALLPTDSQNKQTGGQTSQSKPDAETPKWYTTLERPDWWLVGIAFFTGCVIFWQSWETRKAAQGAKENAKVALAQIQMMKDKERPRLSISEVSQPLFARNSEAVRPNIPLVITLYIINEGNSFAFNVRAMGHVQVEELDDESTFVSVSDESEDWYKLVVPTTIRTVGPIRRIPIVVTCKETAPEIKYLPISEKVAEDIEDGRLTLMIGGEITYEDVFGDEHITPFFYVWVAGIRKSEPTGRTDSEWIDLSGKSN
jgi:hypothetical protein